VHFDTISWHAGKSFYGGRDGLNKYSIGIEIDNAGPLEKVGSEYKSWFGKKYQENDVLYAAHRNNPKKSYWHLYTVKQIEACREICQKLIEKYNIKTIVGHEEIAPTRKTDPGPAFPLDRFREHLLSQNRSDEPDEINAEGIVATDLLNIRGGSGISFQKVAQPLRKGTPVKVLEEHDGWYKVETKITGWVSKAHVQLNNE
jgi:N-acetylmuramoyl-L-alanine amidase